MEYLISKLNNENLVSDKNTNEIIEDNSDKLSSYLDLIWIKLESKPKKRTEPIIEIHNSSSSKDIEYTTKYYPDSGKIYCDCPSTWRAKDRRCKHIKSMELKVKK